MKTMTTEGWRTSLVFHKRIDTPFYTFFDLDEGAGYIVIPEWNPLARADDLTLIQDEYGMPFTLASEGASEDGLRFFESDDFNDITLVTSAALPDRFSATLERMGDKS